MDELRLRADAPRRAVELAAGAVAAVRASREALETARDAVDLARRASNSVKRTVKTASNWWSRAGTVQDSPHTHRRPRGNKIYRTTKSKRIMTTGYRKKGGRTRKGGRTYKKPTLTKQIKDIRKSLKSDQASHSHKKLAVTTVTSAIGEANNTDVSVMDIAALEAAMANLRYYDPAVPGTLVTADASTGTYTRQVHFKNVSSQLTLRNNYQVPCYIRVYLATPRNDTSISPQTFFSNGITDQAPNLATGGKGIQSPLMYLTDINMVKDNWNLNMKKKVFLQPGAQVSCSHNTGSFDYDPSNADTHNLSYQKKYKNFIWIVRIQGVLGHDSGGVASYRFLTAECDALITYRFDITYDAGANLEDYSASDVMGTGAFTNNGVATNRAVADNQQYSVA